MSDRTPTASVRPTSPLPAAHAWLATILCLIAACASVGSRVREQGQPTRVSISLPLPRSISVADRRQADTVWRTMPGVTELGGEVLVQKADTLLLVPNYIILSRSEAPTRSRHFISRGYGDALPSLAVVEIGAGVGVTDYREPLDRGTRIGDAVVSVLGAYLLYRIVRPYFN